MAAIVEPVLAGMLVLLAGTIPRNIVFAANLRHAATVPWAVPVTAVYLWLLWRYLGGWGQPETSADWRRTSLRARTLALGVWMRALAAGILGLAALVVALRVLNRLVVLPEQQPPDLSSMPGVTVLALLLMSSVNAGVVEEAAFRGYMQGPIERRFGPAIAILVTGVMFAVAHLDFTPVLLPYYVAVAVIYGAVTHLTESILPAIVLHTGGNVYSNADLWLRGRAEWQTAPQAGTLIWTSGADRSFWLSLSVVIALGLAALAAYRALAASRAARPAAGRAARA